VARRDSVAGRVAATGRAERVSHITGSLGFALGALGVEASAAMFVPLQFRGVNVGVIEAFDRHDGPEFRADDERLMRAAAASAATAVATAQSVEQDRLRRTLLAAEEERKRWARELHDETLQGLGGLRVLLSSARRSSDEAGLRSAVETAVELLGQEISNLRSLITDLRPAALDDLGLGPALDALFERVRVLQGLEITATVELGSEAGSGRQRLNADVETTVYRVVQEGLTNAVKHGQASQVTVEVVEAGHEVRLSVRDDGRGFDTTAESTGFGLGGMRERIGLAGGRLEISSTADGTVIEATVPASRAVR
jgi:signal transduction histidine kinase